MLSIVNEAIAENKVHMLEKQLKEAQDRIKQLEEALEAVMKWSGSDDSIAGPEIAARKAARVVLAKHKEAKP